MLAAVAAAVHKKGLPKEANLRSTDNHSMGKWVWGLSGLWAAVRLVNCELAFVMFEYFDGYEPLGRFYP